jgi:hypothetical protein
MALSMDRSMVRSGIGQTILAPLARWIMRSVD